MTEEEKNSLAQEILQKLDGKSYDDSCAVLDRVYDRLEEYLTVSVPSEE